MKHWKLYTSKPTEAYISQVFFQGGSDIDSIPITESDDHLVCTTKDGTMYCDCCSFEI